MTTPVTTETTLRKTKPAPKSQQSQSIQKVNPFAYYLLVDAIAEWAERKGISICEAQSNHSVKA